MPRIEPHGAGCCDGGYDLIYPDGTRNAHHRPENRKAGDGYVTWPGPKLGGF